MRLERRRPTGGRPDARRPDGRHARPPAGDRRASCSVMQAARRRRWCCTPATTARRSRCEPFEDANMSLAGVFGRNDGDHEGLRAAGGGGLRHRVVRVAAQLRGRRPAHPARARHRRRPDAVDRGARDRGARLHASAGDEDARRHADRESGRSVRLALRHAVGRDPRPRHEEGRVPSVSTGPRMDRH